MFETHSYPVGSTPGDHHRNVEPMLQEDTVQEVMALLARAEGVKTIACELGVDRKTVKQGRRLGQ